MIDRATRLGIFETSYARRAAWWIELDGRRLAQLSDARWVDMFWWDYAIGAFVDDEARRLVADRELWVTCKLTFRSVPFDILATNAYCGGNGPRDDGRVSMRGMCLPIGEPTLCDRVGLWWRRRQRASESAVAV